MSRGTFTSNDTSAGCPALGLIGMRQEFTRLVEGFAEVAQGRARRLSQADAHERVEHCCTHESARDSRCEKCRGFSPLALAPIPSDCPPLSAPSTLRSALASVDEATLAAYLRV